MKKLLSIIIYIIGFILVWNLCDFLYSTYITGNGYQFAITSDMVLPLSVMVLIQVVEIFGKKEK